MDVGARTWIRPLACLGVGADVLLTLITYGVLLACTTTEPNIRGFFCDDQSIRFPYKAVSVSTTTIAVINVFPVIIMIMWECLRYCRDLRREQRPCLKMLKIVYDVVVVYLFGAGITAGFICICKYNAGRLSPHFITVCEPDWTRINCSEGYIESYDCLGNNTDAIRSARLSFPSEEAGSCLFTLTYLAVFLQYRLQNTSSRLLKPFLLVALLALAVYVTMSRVSDFRRHLIDVVVGAAVGTSLALIMTICVAKFPPRKEDTDESSFSEDEERLNLEYSTTPRYF